MEIELGQVVNILAEAVVQTKGLTEEAKIAIGTVRVKGRNYQVQAILEPIKANHVGAGQVMSQGKVVVEDTRKLFPEPVEEVLTTPITERVKLLLKNNFREDPELEGTLISPKGGKITVEEIDNLGEIHFQEILKMDNEYNDDACAKDEEEYRKWLETQKEENE